MCIIGTSQAISFGETIKSNTFNGDKMVKNDGTPYDLGTPLRDSAL